MKRSKNIRIISLILTLAMLICAIPTLASATTAASFNPAKDIIPGGEGVGFIDNPDGGGSVRGLEATASTVCLRNGEWLKYDLSGLDDGTYVLYITHSNTNAVSLSLTFGEEAVFPKSSINVTGSYSTYVQREIGKVTLNSLNKLLKV